ncbi:YdiU family protein [Roseovarius sp. EL26]|uniref:protein adenylyltransferase SelO n=1 Tax=Roseovarius sp. EL26 TaxID=2126672 RepID=UPI000EA39AA0|nr:YdiU family protein [Roseovarius sp. EL26]
MSITIPFENSYARLPDPFFSRRNPTPVKDPQLIAFNTELATELGITTEGNDDLAQYFSGNTIAAGSDPLAQAYAGHQFGGFSPQLGDGRANLLGEVLDTGGQRRDIQLKGSGPTPYSRNGDGRAWLGPVLREYVVSEAMHALGIPTSRALAAVTTGESVYREQGALPGAILTRVASSHLRVGTFQFFAARRDTEALKTLFDYTVTRHYPDAETPTDLLNAVIDRQARLIAQWMGVGFIHGVMNTDNTTISGETIDYGPCAFMDVFHPDMVFSSIDTQGRYAYSNQPNVIVWNMAQLATSLVQIMPNRDQAVTDFTEAVHAMPDVIHRYWLQIFGRKLGITNATPEDETLIIGLLEIMANNRADFTNTFRALGTEKARDQFLNPKDFDTWEVDWKQRLNGESNPESIMQASNPWIIPRNHRIEELIQAAVAGDYTLFETLRGALATPFTPQPELQPLTHAPTSDQVVRQTFCGT